MNNARSAHLLPRSIGILIGLALLLAACSPPIQQPKGPAKAFIDAKDLFKRGQFDRAADFAEGPATASPADSYTDRARLLRLVVYTGQMRGYKELAEAYAAGVKASKNPRFQSEYERLRHDSLQYGAERALHLGDTVHAITAGGQLPKEVTLELPYPDVEGPPEVTQFEKVREGGWIEPADQDAASTAALRKGINDTLAELVVGDRAKARTVLGAGPLKISGVDFGLFVTKDLIDAAGMFDRKHFDDPQKLRLLAEEADETAKDTLALLKDAPDKATEKKVKDAQDQIKKMLKAI